MSQPSWAAIEAAMQGAVRTASGLSTIWRYQAADEPALDYVGLSLGAMLTEGIDFLDERYDNTQPAHHEIVLTVGGVREVTLQIEVWSGAVVETVAKATALSILDGIVTKFRLPNARNTLAAVGVVPFDPGPSTWLPSIVAAGFRGRATCDVRCRMPARALVEYADYIASITGSATIPGVQGGDILLPLSAPYTGGATDRLAFFGVAADPGVYDQAFVESFAHSIAFKRQDVSPLVFDASGTTDYCWLWIPQSYGGTTANFIDAESGLEVDMSVVGTAIRAEPGGAVVTYNGFRSAQRGLGPLTVNVT